jgi:hypothetical protein
MRAWLKQEKKYGRIYDRVYLDWLEQEFGPIENAGNSWLMKTND